MGKVYFISDLHFGHENIAKHRGFKSSAQHDEHIIKQWNSVVSKYDMVWILGDIGMEKSSHYHLLNRCKGFKKIILGNHDKLEHVPELMKYCLSVGGMAKYKGCILTHCPIHPKEIRDFRRNIHGHVHEKTVNAFRYINVSCDVLDYTPIEFTELLRINAKDMWFRNYTKNVFAEIKRFYNKIKKRKFKIFFKRKKNK